ncbi:MAG: DNA polymerase III subunit gamma/tau [Bacteroidales bacterium]|nr:DNA polymerase III subunit gamma/tau [Bacteroidales bacterium]
MGQFIVSARKYRPNNFESLIGQENIARTLKNSILRNQLAHAYLFCGPRGVGKTSTARIFAKTINCYNPSEGMEPCGECESCLSFAEGRSYSIHELDAASNNSVEDIRTLTDQVRVPPQIGKYSVYIIDEVHMLSQQAFNAFLKTLEEPPSHAIFILATTEKHKILPTILSRCQTYDFNRISVDNIVRNLTGIAQKEGVDISSDALHIIAQKADGAMRDALTLFDQTVAFCGTDITYEQVIKNLNVLDYEYYFRLTSNFLAGDYTSAMITFDEILSKGFNALHFISGLSSHFRDLLVCKNDASQTLLELAPSIAQRYKNAAAECSLDFLYEALSHTTSCEAGYKTSGNPRLSIEFTLLKLSQILYRQTVRFGDTSVSTQQTAKKIEIQPNPVAVGQKPETSPEPIKEKIEIQDDLKHDTSKKTHVTGGLSIKAMMNKVNQSNSPVEKVVEEECEINEEELNKAWIKLAESECKMPRLSSAISQTTPILLENKTDILFRVSNESQIRWIERNCLMRMDRFLQETLKNKKIKLKLELLLTEDGLDKQKLYMPSEKAKHMLENSAELRELHKDLDLETS